MMFSIWNDQKWCFREYDSVLDAASKGAIEAFKLVAGIIASVIAFLAFVYTINGILGWLGVLVGD